MGLALVVALCSAGLFATGSSLQHRTAQHTATTTSTGLLATLVTRRDWLIGSALCATAFALHATALHLGSLILVQPVIVTGIVFTVIIRAALDRHRPARAEIAWAGLTWAGLAVFVATLRQSTAHDPDPARAVMITAVGAGVAGGLALVARLVSRRALRGALLAGASGLLFGLVAGLVKLSTTSLAATGWAGLVTSWPPWALIVVGLGAVALNQLAYRSTRLSLSTPILNIVQLVVAIGFGLSVFAERLLDRPAAVVAQVVGLAGMITGVVLLARRAARDDVDRKPSTSRSQAGPGTVDAHRPEARTPCPSSPPPRPPRPPVGPPS